jgi:hypothetical protein
MIKPAAGKSERLSPYLEVDSDGAVRVRLGDFLRSKEGRTQLKDIRRVTEVAKRQLRGTPSKR